MSRIETKTFDFLRQLKENNTREWFAAHRADYDFALDNVRCFITDLIGELSHFDPRINTSIQASKCLFRIYRDTRFSLDKTPYKSWFGAGISVDGRKLHGPEYYIHIAPDESFVAGGYWRPEKNHLEAIRQEIDYNGNQLKSILDQVLADSRITLSQEDKLKRAPAGYGEDNTFIELIKLKSFVLEQFYSEKEMYGKDALKNIVASYQNMLPFKQFLQDAIESE